MVQLQLADTTGQTMKKTWTNTISIQTHAAKSSPWIGCVLIDTVGWIAPIPRQYGDNQRAGEHR
jgi:hypothetical protein